MLTVADNGRKLTEAEKACLMHSLESVKPDGLGLGLSIVRGIADSHGAKIEFVAKPAGGVVVSVLFDELDEEAAARAAGAIDAGRNRPDKTKETDNNGQSHTDRANRRRR